ncbi:MAG: hypothetical protein Q8L66_15365 [Caulobacter sp.]|nr:hypothetical protein [Caulobacter sp.]
MSSAFDYPAFRREAGQALIDLNEAANARFGLSAWERFELDLASSTLTFSHKGKDRVVADIQLVGGLDGDWTWAWAWEPGDCAPSALDAVQSVRTWGQARGVRELTTPRHGAPDPVELGWALTAVAARLSSAQGAYRVVNGDRSLFVLYREITAVDQAGSVTALSRTTPRAGRQSGARNMSQ